MNSYFDNQQLKLENLQLKCQLKLMKQHRDDYFDGNQQLIRQDETILNLKTSLEILTDQYNDAKCKIELLEEELQYYKNKSQQLQIVNPDLKVHQQQPPNHKHYESQLNQQLLNFNNLMFELEKVKQININLELELQSYKAEIQILKAQLNPIQQKFESTLQQFVSTKKELQGTQNKLANQSLHFEQMRLQVVNALGKDANNKDYQKYLDVHDISQSIIEKSKIHQVNPNMQQEVEILKKSVCEFFTKILATIKDPLIMTRTRWNQFRGIFLDELITPNELYNYVKNLNYNDNHLQVEVKREIQSERKQQLQPQQQNNCFVKQPSFKKQTQKQEKPVIQDRYDNIEKCDFSQKNNNYYQQRKKTFDRQRIIQDLEEALQKFRKNGVSLGMIYSKSFEINTSDFEPSQQSSFSQNRAAQQDLLQLQQNQRGELRKYSIYTKDDKEGARQQVEKIANENNVRKIYY